jgi:S1-C subfamily serine protease
LTCQHVIDDAETIKVGVGGDVYPAKVVRSDKHNDLALLKITDEVMEVYSRK